MKHYKIITICLLLALCGRVSGQIYRLYNASNGLTSTLVNDIYQDREGFVWISTEDGLARFNGMDFRSWHYDGKQPNTLASNFVVRVYEDSHGRFWVATSKGLQLFRRQDGSFSLYDLRDPEVPGSMLHVTSVTEISGTAGGSEIWVSCSEHGIYVIDAVSGILKPERRKALQQAGISDAATNIFQDSRGRVWILYETGINLLSDVSTLEYEGLEEWDSAIFLAIAEDSVSGDIFLGSTNMGLLNCRQGSNQIKHCDDPATRRLNVQALLPWQDLGNGGTGILVGTENHGLKIYRTDKSTLEDPDMKNLPEDEPEWKVHCLLRDNQDDLWMGAFHKGVLVVPASMYGFTRHGHKNSTVTSMLRYDRDGSLWTGTDGGGIFRYRDGVTSNYNQDNSGLDNNSVMALCQDKHGKIWIATYLGGLFLYDGVSIRPYRGNGLLASDKTVTLAYNPELDMIYAGTYGGGFSIISAQDGSFVRRIADAPMNWVNSLYLDEDGLLWIGTFNGIFRFNATSGKTEEYELGDAGNQARIYCFCQDTTGIIWTGTGEGVLKMDLAEGSNTLYSAEDGLSGNVVCSILKDDGGELWMSTTNGLTRYSPKTGEWSSYYAFDGLQSNEFYYRSAFKDCDGTLFFGGLDGFTSFRPESTRSRGERMQPVHISGISVMNEPIEVDLSGITLPSGSKLLDISYAVMEYTNPGKISFSYIMEGFDEDWHHSDPSSRTATYTNLPPGHYNFVVKACFSDNPKDSTTARIPIRVMQPWYKSAAAMTFYAIFAVLLGLYFKHVYERRRRMKEDKHKSQIQAMKLEMFTNMSHEIRTPLTLVQAPLKELREKEKDPERHDLYNLMYRNCLRINRMANQLIDIQKIDSGKMDFHFRETDLVFFIKDIMKSFDNMAESGKIDFSLAAALPSQTLWLDQGNFDKIIFNILSNAFKFTPDGGRVKVAVSPPVKNDGTLDEGIAKMVRIDISNSGSHISAPNPDKVFERFYQSNPMDARVGTGVGLNLAQLLVNKHHGAIKAMNTDDGVLFSVFLPEGNAHLSREELSSTTHHLNLYDKTKYAEELVDSHEDQTYVPEKEEDKMLKSRKTIALVDDDEEFCTFLRRSFRGQYNVRIFPGGKEAWAYISTEVPDAVITDLVMEGMNGLELCDRIKRNPGTNHVPVIMLTSHTGELTEQKSLENGADVFITKPVNLDILRTNLSNLILTRDTIRSKFTTSTSPDYESVKMGGTELSAKVTAIINDNIDNPDFSVEQLSREVGMSRVHMNRKLKETMNISPSMLIKSMRLKQAAYLLINNKVNISEVAYRVGFATPSYFSSTFHDYFGMTPKDFVTKYQNCTDEDVLKKLFE